MTANQDPIRKRVKRFLQARKNDLIYLLARLGLAIARIVPLAVGLRVGGFLGGMTYHVLPRDVQLNTERFNRLIEWHLRKHPEQWVWNHRRWRRERAWQPIQKPSSLESLNL